MKHADLVKRAAAYLANTKRCPVVITEMSGQGEEPDAIGWNAGGHSCLVECKATVSDFKADRWKAGRRLARLGMGNHRFYLVPPEILQYAVENAPPRWGVLVAYKRRVEQRKAPDCFPEAYKLREIGLLISSLRRLAGEKTPIKGMNVRYYTIDALTNPRATIGIESCLKTAEESDG
jgi:hypothetical protein